MRMINSAVLVVIISIIAGALTYQALSLTPVFRREALRTTSDTVQACPSELSASECLLVYPQYNLDASVGDYGLPISEGRYYCTNDDACMKISFSNQARFINIAMLTLSYMFVASVVIFIKAMSRKKKA